MTASTITSQDPSSHWILKRFWPILAILLVARLLIDRALVLVPDEAVYWSWSRHLALGYLAHPPLIAWLAWLSTRVTGSNELGVRLPAAPLATASLAVLIGWVAPKVTPAPAARAMLAMIWLSSPMLFGFATIATPDTPVFFFSTCALACATMIAWTDQQRARNANEAIQVVSGAATSLATEYWWLLFGVFTGLALLSKYTAVLVPGAVVCWLLTSQPGRTHLRQPWVYLAAAIALLIFSPVIYWNARHGWASFEFQLHHGMSAEAVVEVPGAAPRAPLTSLAHTLLTMLLHASGYLGGQALLWTPVLFVLGMITLCCGWRRFPQLGSVDRLLLWSATIPLGFFFAAWVRKPGEINWPAFAYVPLSILMVRRTGAVWRGPWAGWLWQGCKVAIVFAIAMHVLLLPQAVRVMARLHFRPPHNVSDLHAPWPAMGVLIKSRAQGALIVCNRHQDAGEVAFYVPGQPDVWCDGVGSRVTAFDYFDKPPKLGSLDRVFFVGGHAGEFAAEYQFPQASPQVLKVGPGAGLARPSVLFIRGDQRPQSPSQSSREISDPP